MLSPVFAFYFLCPLSASNCPTLDYLLLLPSIYNFFLSKLRVLDLWNTLPLSNSPIFEDWGSYTFGCWPYCLFCDEVMLNVLFIICLSSVVALPTYCILWCPYWVCCWTLRSACYYFYVILFAWSTLLALPIGYPFLSVFYSFSDFTFTPS